MSSEKDVFMPSKAHRQGGIEIPTHNLSPKHGFISLLFPEKCFSDSLSAIPIRS